MSTITLTHPNAIPFRRNAHIGRALRLAALVMIAAALVITLILANAHLADPSASPRVTAVPTPPIAEPQLTPSATPAPATGANSQAAVLPVPVPTPPLP